MLFWVSAVFVLGYGMLLGYYRHHWLRVPHFKPVLPKHPTFISVVIAARNEAATLPLLLQALGRQTYPRENFEVIVVDDYSTDATMEVVQPYLNDRVYCIQPQVGAERSSKKQALTAGVARARGPLVVVTDADCVPQPRWLELVAAFYMQHQPAFVVMPVQFSAAPTLLGIFQQLDFLMLQGITAASIQAETHSMCNGANLAYEKQAFTAVDGFAGIDARASGDDMLLLYKVAQRYPAQVRYLKHPEVIMPTPAQESWRSLLQQRIRWSSKATYYQDKSITAVLFFVYAFNLWCFILFAAACFHTPLWWYILGCLFFKTVFELALLAPVARFFQNTALLWYFPWLQPVHIVYTVLTGLLSRRKTYQWKGRTTQ